MFKRVLHAYYDRRIEKLHWRICRSLQFKMVLYKYIILYKNKKKKLLQLLNFLMWYNGLYRTRFLLISRLKYLYKDEVLKRHCLVHFLFGPQQIFFQLFVENIETLATHSSVGALVRIRENIREHGGRYVYRFDETAEIDLRERNRDKKRTFYYYPRKGYDNFRNTFANKNLIHPELTESKEQLLRRAKKDLLLQKARKRNKNIESVIVYNRRGNPKTEPLYGKFQRRKFSV